MVHILRFPELTKLFKRSYGLKFCICIDPMPVCGGFTGAGATAWVTLLPRVFPLLATADDTATIFIGRIMSLSS